MPCTLELDGLDETIDMLRMMGKAGNKALDEALKKAAEPIVDAMIATNMFDDRSGKLRESLKVSKVRTRKDGKYIWIGDIDREAPYGWYVEYGDSKHVARPFMRQAYREEKAEALKIMKQEIEKAFKDLEV